jgi:hypothetical protein
LKEWMGLERSGDFHLESQHILGFVGIRLSAFIAPNREGFTDKREWSYSIGLREGDFMPEEKILSYVKPMVLAKNNPAIIGVFPHVRLRHPSERD